MPAFKLVLSDPRSGRSRQLEIKDPDSQRLLGLRIGDVVDASLLGEALKLPNGFRIRITGGSGIEGAPMLPTITGPVKRYALLRGPPGYHPKNRGIRRRKLVRGDTVSDQVVQLNAVILYPPNWNGGPVIAVQEDKAQST
jgi:small subunit ribosomal protein S6e